VKSIAQLDVAKRKKIGMRSAAILLQILAVSQQCKPHATENRRTS